MPSWSSPFFLMLANGIDLFALIRWAVASTERYLSTRFYFSALCIETSFSSDSFGLILTISSRLSLEAMFLSSCPKTFCSSIRACSCLALSFAVREAAILGLPELGGTSMLWYYRAISLFLFLVCLSYAGIRGEASIGDPKMSLSCASKGCCNLLCPVEFISLISKGVLEFLFGLVIFDGDWPSMFIPLPLIIFFRFYFTDLLTFLRSA